MNSILDAWGFSILAFWKKGLDSMTQHYPLALIADKPHLTGRSIFFCLFCVYLFMWFPGDKLAGWSCVIRQLARVLVWCNVLTYFFPFLSDSGYNAININNWSACGQETFDVKKQNQKKRLVTSVFAWQSSRCDLTITRRIGRNGIPLRSIFARCILLRCWWSKCNCDFKDLGKKRITAERTQKTIWFKRGSAAWRKRRKV